MQEGNKRVQGGTLETVVPGLGSTLPSATPSAALCWDAALAVSGGKAGPFSTMGKGLGFFLGKAACFPIPCFGRTSTTFHCHALSLASLFPGPHFPSPWN